MKKGKRRRPSAQVRAEEVWPRVTDRRIVVIDDGAVRAGAAKEWSRAMAKLEAARGELRRFEEEDRPAFDRWMAATFGALLTECRENERVIYEQEGLIEEVEFEMILNNHGNARRAYAAVMKRREGPSEDDFEEGGGFRDDGGEGKGGEAGDAFDPFGGDGGEIPEGARRALFEDFLSTALFLDPKDLTKGEYEQLFAEFEKELFGAKAKKKPVKARDGGKREEAAGQDRIKEIYRMLVRRLHPDTRADGDATVSALWHQVQEAYEARDLDRMETLLALTEMENGGDGGGQASVSQMRRALAELKRALGAIQRSVAAAKRDAAWDFGRNPYRGVTEKRIRRELEGNVAEQRRVMAELKRVIDDWSGPSRAAARKGGKPSKRAGRGGGGGGDGWGAVQRELFEL